MRPAGRDDAEPFGRIVAECFGMSERAGSLCARLVGRPRWHAYLSVDAEGAPAGTGAMFVEGEVAWRVADFWSDACLGIFAQTLAVRAVPPHGCRLLTLRPA